MCQRLLLLPDIARVAVVPAGPGALDPAPRKGLSDLLFPLRIPVGDGDFAVEVVPVGVFFCHQAAERGALGQRDQILVTNLDEAVG